VKKIKTTFTYKKSNFVLVDFFMGKKTCAVLLFPYVYAGELTGFRVGNTRRRNFLYEPLKTRKESLSLLEENSS